MRARQRTDDRSAGHRPNLAVLGERHEVHVGDYPAFHRRRVEVERADDKHAVGSAEVACPDGAGVKLVVGVTAIDARQLATAAGGRVVAVRQVACVGERNEHGEQEQQCEGVELGHVSPLVVAAWAG